MRRILAVAAMAAALALLFPHASQAVAYRITEIGIPTGDISSRAAGIDGNGNVVGESNDGTHTRAWYWSQASGFTILPPAPGESYTRIGNISDSGLICGWSRLPDSYYCVWTASGLQTVGSKGVTMLDINDAGNGAGAHLSSATFIDHDGTVTDIGTGSAWGINELDEVVGQQGSSGVYYAFYWSKDTGRIELGRGSAQAINNNGQIAVYSLGRACVWDRFGNKRELPIPDGYTDATANDINDAGQVAGSLFGTACVWDADGTITLLPNLPGFGRTYTYGINESGWIAGMAYDASGNQHAVLWQPVPEPAAIVVLVSGVLGLMWRRRRG